MVAHPRFLAMNRAHDPIPLELKNTNEGIVKYSIYQPKTHNLGIIYLSSFVPLSGDHEACLLVIRNLLVNELKDTNAVVFDARGNPGGRVNLADSLSQLFAPDIVPGSARALVAPINREIFLNSPEYARDHWSKAYEKAKQGDTYAPSALFTPIKVANALGQAYIKPVGVLHNGDCYSSCDTFAAAIQDNNVGTIFGEDLQSGGGYVVINSSGANVYEVKEFFGDVVPRFFPPFPYQQQLGEYSQDFSIPWRQTIRTGKNKGKLIEDAGVKADIVVRPTIADILPNSTTYSQYERIAEELNKQARASGKDSMYFRTLQDLRSDVAMGSKITFDLEIQGISRVVAYDDRQKELSSLSIKQSERSKKQSTKFSFDHRLKIGTIAYLNLKAFDASNRQLFTTNRIVRIIPQSKSFLKLAAGVSTAVNLKGVPYAAQFDSSPGNGWTFRSGRLTIGDGKQYLNDVDSSLIYFVNTAVPFKIAIDATYHTELDFDFFKVGYVKDGVTTQLLTSKVQDTDDDQDGISGSGSLKQTFEIPAIGEVEIFVQFISDSLTTDVGATINSISFSAK
jgi:hypothetical protein